MPANRRDFVKFAGGAAVGTAASPLPWKLLDDTSIWSQNWSAIPKLPRGAAEAKATRCTLCPSGCAVNATLVGGVPVRLSGRLCAAGHAAHQLPWHPFRLHPGNLDAAVERVTVAIRTAKKPVAILDGRPERTASRMYRQALASWPGAVYLTNAAAPATGVNFDRIDTVVGFGVDAVAIARGKRLLQVDARHSLAASVAARWYAVKPGCEGLIALAVARRLSNAKDLAALNAGELVDQAGMDAGDFAELCTAFEQGKAYAVGANADLLNAVAVKDALVARRAAPDVEAPTVRSMLVSDAAAEQFGVLIVDAAALDIDISARTLRSLVGKQGLLVVVSAYESDLTAEADVAIAAPAVFESWDDIVTPPSYAVAAPLLPAAEGLLCAADFVARVAALGLDLKSEIERRAAAIQASGRGTLEQPAKQVYEALVAGSAWTDEPAPAKLASLPAYSTARWTPQADFPLALIPFRTSELPSHQAQPPVLTKIYQESELRPSAGTVRVHPETAAASGLAHNTDAIVRTSLGDCRVRVLCDRLVQKGVIEAPLSPSRAELAGTVRPSTPQMLNVSAGQIAAARIERA